MLPAHLCNRDFHDVSDLTRRHVRTMRPIRRATHAYPRVAGSRPNLGLNALTITAEVSQLSA
jgi:hypothetical protein